MTAWIVFAAIGLGTFALRASAFALIGDRPLPGWTAAPLAMVAPAAITALTISMLFTNAGSVQLASIPELLAVAAAFVVTRRTGNVMFAIGTAMPVFWLASTVFS